MKKIDIAAIPELNTSVGLHGSTKQEVYGPIIVAVAYAIIMGVS